MMLWVLGLNHQTAPVELRERVSFAGEALPAALASLRAHPQVLAGEEINIPDAVI